MRFRAVLALYGAILMVGCKSQEAAPPQAQQPSAAEPQAQQPSAAEPQPTPAAASASPPEPSLGARRGGERELATLPEAEEALGEAARNLDTLLGGKGPAGDASRLSSGDPRCPAACKAMSSLRRAAAAVCRLAGEATDRCGRAKTVVKDSESRVAACKCEGDKP